MSTKPIILIFDYDGVIAETDGFNYYAINQSLIQHGLSLTHDEYEQYFSGKKLRNGFIDYLNNIGNMTLLNQLLEAKKSYDHEYKKNIKSYPDALNLIQYMRNKDQIVCLATGARKDQVDIAIECFGLSNIFSVITTANDYNEGKPAPDIYHYTLDKLQQIGITTETHRIIVIEDTEPGISAAHNAGLECIAVTHTHFREDLQDADLVVDDLRELQGILIKEESEERTRKEL